MTVEPSVIVHQKIKMLTLKAITAGMLFFKGAMTSKELDVEQQKIEDELYELASGYLPQESEIV